METRKNMKGFIFTLDAVFSLVVAAVGVSILLYVDFTSATSYGAATAQASGILQSMLQTSVSSGAAGSQYLSYLALSSNASSYTWPQFGRGASLGSSTGYSPQGPFLLYTWNAGLGNVILPSVAVNTGFVAVAAGTKVYLINATTGQLKSTAPSGNPSNVVDGPAIYKNTLIYANASDSVVGINVYNSLLKWSYNTGNQIITPIEMEDNYVAFGTTQGFYLINPINGSLVAYENLAMPTQTPLYVNGEFVVSTTSQSSQNLLYSYSLQGNSLVGTWNAPLSTAQTTAPSYTNGTIAVGSGNFIYIFNTGGSQIYQSVDTLSRIIGIGTYGNYYYVQSAQDLYYMSATSGNVVFATSTVPDLQNSTPTVGPTTVYTLINGNLFQAYSTSNYRMLWNYSLPSNAVVAGDEQAALAYGNIYVTNGNTLYVFGTYKPKQSDNMLQSLGSMYLNGQGDYADALLQSVYNSSTTGIFINSTYAPTLAVATFNSQSNSYIEQADGFAWANNPSAHFTISVWVYPISGSGVIVDELGQVTPNTNWHSSVLDLVNGNVFATLPGLSCLDLGSIPYNSWSSISLTWSSNSASGTMAGYINGAVSNTPERGTWTLPVSGNALYFPLGVGDSTNCGSASYFTGEMLDYQFYNETLNSQQVSQLYHLGAFGGPVNQSRLNLWLPLIGNGNDFSSYLDFGIPYGIQYTQTSYVPQRLANAYQISKASVPMYLTSNGIIKEYNVSVVAWR